MFKFQYIKYLEIAQSKEKSMLRETYFINRSKNIFIHFLNVLGVHRQNKTEHVLFH